MPKVLGEVEMLDDELPSCEMLHNMSTSNNLSIRFCVYFSRWLLSRKVMYETEIGGYLLSPVTNIFISSHYIRHHPDSWEKPNKFG